MDVDVDVNVFISWSGGRSKQVARYFHDWLPNVIQVIRPWMSDVDMDKGVRWSTEISARLAETRIGIVCLTRENLREPWILFETGALAKTLHQTYVCPLLIDLDPSDLSWPLAMFQATTCQKDEIRKLLHTINGALKKESILTEAKVNNSFDIWWPALENELRALPASPTIAPVRTQAEIMEEMLGLLRTTTSNNPLTDTTAEIISRLQDLRSTVNDLNARIGYPRAPEATMPHPAPLPTSEPLTRTRIVDSPQHLPGEENA